MAIRTYTTTESAASWAARPFLPDEIRPKAANADILLVPTEGYAGRPDLTFFPAGTTDLFRFLRRRVPDTTVVEACMADSDYCEVARHAAILYIAGFVVTSLAAPLLVRLLGDYLKHKIDSRNEASNVSTSITIYDQAAGRSICMEYDGPAQDFETTALAALKELQRPVVPKLLEPSKNRDESDRPSNRISS